MWFAAAVTLALFSSSQAYHVTPPTASVARGGRSSHSLYSLKIRSASFFGIGATRRSLQLSNAPKGNRLQLTSIPNGEQNTLENEVQVPKPEDGASSSGVTNEATPSTSLLQSIDKLGMKLKPLAQAAHDKSIDAKSTKNVNGSSSEGNLFASVLYSIKSNVLWMLYIIYRGYRGFFVILPAVFREVFRQLKESNVAIDAFGDEQREEMGVNPVDQKSMRLRTRVTISVLSGILTLSYVISGAFRVLGKKCWLQRVCVLFFVYILNARHFNS